MIATWFDDGSEIEDKVLSQEGIGYYELPTEGYQPAIDQLKRVAGYVQQDIVELNPSTPNLDMVCAKFANEHYHQEDEVRFVLDGEGVFDIRSADDRWMRVAVTGGDLVVVPAKRWHRFFLTDARTIRCVRLFHDPRGWVAHFRDE